MAVTIARIKSIFDAFGVTPEEHAAANGETVDEMYARMEEQHTQDTIVASLLRAYPDQGDEFVTALFENRDLQMATADETAEDRATRITAELSGGRTFSDLQASLDRLGPETGGATPDTISVLTSPSMQWSLDPSNGTWHLSYQLPNSDKRVFVEATGQEMDAIFGEGNRPNTYGNLSFEELSESQTFVGDILEMSGTGSFEAEVQRTIQLGLDEGTLPAWARQDPAVMDLIYIQYTEGKSTEWLTEQISKLDSFKARYPGIDEMKKLGMTTTEAVQGFLEMEIGIKGIMLRSGSDPSALTPDVVGDLISMGHSLTDVEKAYDTFDRYKTNENALGAFNEVLAERGIAPMGPEDMFEFLEGNAPTELYDIWEEASFQEAATAAGLDMSVADAVELAGLTEGHTTLAEGYGALTGAAQNILRFRTDIDLGRYELDAEDLIDISLGIAPRSGRTAADISRNMERAIQSARAGVDGPRANRFRQFTAEGVPQAVSTSRSRAQE